MITTLAGYVHAQLAAPHQKFEAIRDNGGTLLGIASVNKLRTAFYATSVGEAKSNRISMELSIALVELRNKALQTEGEVGWNNLANQRLLLPVTGQVDFAERALKIARIDLRQFNPDQINRLRKIEQGMVYVDKGYHEGIPDEVENMSNASGASGLDDARLTGDVSALWRMRGTREQRAEQFHATRYKLDPDSWKISGILPRLVPEPKLNGTSLEREKARVEREARDLNEGRAMFLEAIKRNAQETVAESPTHELWTVPEPKDNVSQYTVKHDDFLQRRGAVREHKEAPPVAPKPRREASPKAGHEVHYAAVGVSKNGPAHIPNADATDPVAYATVRPQDPNAPIAPVVKRPIAKVFIEGQAQREQAAVTITDLLNDGVSAKGKFTQGFINNPSRALVYHEAVQEAWVQISHAKAIYTNSKDPYENLEKCKDWVANLAGWQAQAVEIRRNNGLLDKLDPKSVPVRIYHRDLEDLSDSGLRRLQNLWEKSNEYAREYFDSIKYDNNGEIVHSSPFRTITTVSAALDLAKGQFKPLDTYTSDLAKKVVYELQHTKTPQRVDDAELHDLVAFYRANNPSSTL